jgi:hypothetical protein
MHESLVGCEALILATLIFRGCRRFQVQQYYTFRGVRMVGHYRVSLHAAVSVKSLAYHRCETSSQNGTGPWMPSIFRPLLKKTLFNPTTTSLCSLSTSALRIRSPSESRGPIFRGLSPQRTTISVGVFSTISKWSDSWVPGSYVDVANCSVVQSWFAVAGPLYFRER